MPKTHSRLEKAPIEAWEKGKTTKPPILKQAKPICTTKPLERIHTDLNYTRQPYQYLLVVVDDFSRHVSLRKKSDAGDALIEIENSTNLHSNQVQAD